MPLGQTNQNSTRSHGQGVRYTVKSAANGTAPIVSRGCSNWYQTLFAKQLYVNPAVGDVQEDSLKVE